MSITGPATSRGVPSLGATCMRKPGRRVDLADAAADGSVALGDVFGEEIHAADVQPDRAHRAHRHLAVVRMDDVGDVGGGAAGGQVGGGAQTAPPRPACGTESALVADAFEHHMRLRIELEAGQHLFVADAAARILVDDLDELRDGVLPSPTTWPGVRRVAATSSPLTTSRR